MKKTKIIFIIIFSVLLFKIPENCCEGEITFNWDEEFGALLTDIREGNWEEALVRINYLDDVTTFNPKYSSYHNEIRNLRSVIEQMKNKDLEKLYQKGLSQIKQNKLKEAEKIFKKIIFYDSRFKNSKEIFQKLSTLMHPERKTVTPIVVTSPTIDKRKTGLQIYKPNKCYNGYTLFVHSSLDIASPIKFIYLINMKGEIVYQWTIKGDPVFAQLTPDGNVMYIDHEGIKELNYKSKVIWEYPGCIDHAFEVIDNQNVGIERGENADTTSKCVGEDGLPPWYSIIEIVNKKKGKIWEWHSKNHIKDLEKLLNIKIYPIGDWANCNSCQVLPPNPIEKTDPRFRHGNILFSFTTLRTIGIIDRKTKNIVWGNAQRLPNGNTSICESESNRFFEITPQGEIAWDFISPFNKITGGEGIY